MGDKSLTRIRIRDAHLTDLYRGRLAREDPRWRARAWAVLVERVFQAYVESTDTVVDLGAGWCEFINAVRCRRKIAVDLNPDVQNWAKDAEIMLQPCTDLSPIADDSVDVAFSSNLFEHLADREEILGTLVESYRILRPGGASITVMPNVRYVRGHFWDYFDHITPLTHVSLAEAYALTGYEVERVIARFTPNELRARWYPHSTTLLRLYLRLRFLWPIFGRQMVVVGRKPGNEPVRAES